MAHIRLDQITERYLVDGIDVTIKGGVVTSAVVEVRLDDEGSVLSTYATFAGSRFKRDGSVGNARMSPWAIKSGIGHGDNVTRFLLDHIDNSSQLAERLIADLNAAG